MTYSQQKEYSLWGWIAVLVIVAAFVAMIVFPIFQEVISGMLELIMAFEGML